jgi:3-carboxy-cis,cis-muconate cycloisomerase
MQTEVGEVAEPAAPGRGGSSTLPHKRNPVGAAAVSTAARTTQALVPILLGSLVAEHERGLGGWPAEWETLSQLLALTGGAVARTAETVTALEVDVEAMAAGVARTGGLVLAERVSFALARRGADPARGRRAVADAVGRVLAGEGDFRAELLAEPVVAGVLSAEELDELLDPGSYLGATDIWIDRALAAYERSRPPSPA